MTPGLILPRSVAESRKVLRCTVPGCGMDFPMEQRADWVRHVKACATRNADKLEAHVHRIRSNYFSHPADEERYAFERRRGAQEERA